MNYPFIEEEWIRTLTHLIKKGHTNSILGKYIAKMRLCSFKEFEFEDSDRLNKYRNSNDNGIPIEKCEYEIKLIRSEHFKDALKRYCDERRQKI